MKKYLLYIMKCFHKCSFDKIIQKSYSVMYTEKWIIYNQQICKCGKHIESKMCGTINIDDIPKWSIENFKTK